VNEATTQIVVVAVNRSLTLKHSKNFFVARDDLWFVETFLIFYLNKRVFITRQNFFSKKMKRDDTPTSSQQEEKLIRIPNRDKTFHESWYPGRNLLNIPHPFRAILAGPPNRGKSTICKNLLLRADPPFEQVIVVHYDLETKEYDDLKGEHFFLLNTIPNVSEFSGKRKTFIILDDLPIKQLKKDQQILLNRLYGYMSTHKNISICLCSQDAYEIPVLVRRSSNLWVLWKGVDHISLKQLSKRGGCENLMDLMKRYLHISYDSIWLDSSPNSPAPIRVNGYKVIPQSCERDEEEEREVELERLEENAIH